jgi:hypothetical protein
MTCRVCGCSDFDACVDPVTGETCWWVREELCSTCAMFRSQLHEAFDAGYQRPDGNEPRVSLATEADLNELLREREGMSK